MQKAEHNKLLCFHEEKKMLLDCLLVVMLKLEGHLIHTYRHIHPYVMCL